MHISFEDMLVTKYVNTLNKRPHSRLDSLIQFQYVLCIESAKLNMRNLYSVYKMDEILPRYELLLAVKV